MDTREILASCEGKTVAELRDIDDAMRIEIMGIDAQLGDRKPIGKVSDEEWREYRTWKSSAMSAKTYMLRARVTVKKLIRDKRVVIPDDEVKELSEAVVLALGATGDSEICRRIYSAIGEVYESWEHDTPDAG